jgi:hypothetical protein
MPKGRRATEFEKMPAHPGFRATVDQFEWLDAARLAAGVTSLSEWLRQVASEAGEKQLGKPFPRRKLNPPKKRPK